MWTKSKNVTWKLFEDQKSSRIQIGFQIKSENQKTLFWKLKKRKKQQIQKTVLFYFLVQNRKEVTDDVVMPVGKFNLSDSLCSNRCLRGSFQFHPQGHWSI